MEIQSLLWFWLLLLRQSVWAPHAQVGLDLNFVKILVGPEKKYENEINKRPKEDGTKVKLVLKIID